MTSCSKIETGKRKGQACGTAMFEERNIFEKDKSTFSSSGGHGYDSHFEWGCCEYGAK